MHEIANELLNWSKTIDRDLPWKNTDDPYFIWLSEIILQQTRVAQGTPYYLKFIELFPTVFDLANASQEELYKAWEGLGYYSRARNLHASAKMIVEEFEGKFPSTYDDIINLKGVGPYTAAAIASFAFGEDKAVLDGNVFRVISRLFDVDTDILSSQGKKEFQLLTNELLPKGHSSAFNQAIMDFGALHCVGKTPDCMFCPLQSYCSSYKNGTVHLRPVKKKAAKKKDRYFHFLVLGLPQNSDEDSLYFVEKRTGKDIWSGLYQFPLIVKNNASIELSKNEWEKDLNISLRSDPAIIHKSEQILSHQKIHARFYKAEVSDDNSTLADNDNNSTYKALTMEEIDKLGFPRIIRKFLDEWGM